jgi:hypothetical protein
MGVSVASLLSSINCSPSARSWMLVITGPAGAGRGRPWVSSRTALDDDHTNRSPGFEDRGTLCCGCWGQHSRDDDPLLQAVAGACTPAACTLEGRRSALAAAQVEDCRDCCAYNATSPRRLGPCGCSPQAQDRPHRLHRPSPQALAALAFLADGGRVKAGDSLRLFPAPAGF